MIIAELSSILFSLIVLGIEGLIHFLSQNANEGLEFMNGQITCLLWSQLLIIQSFEWELITSLIAFQKKVQADEIGVRRQEYMTTVERKTEVRFIFITLYNLLFHVIKSTLYFINRLKDHKNPRPLFVQQSFWDGIFVFSLALLVIVCGIRLLKESKSNHVEAYR